MIRMVLPVLLTSLLLCFTVDAESDLGTIHYTLIAEDSSGELVATGSITYNFQRQSIAYELNSSDQRGWLPFEHFTDGAAQALVHFAASSMTLTQVRLFSTPFLPLRFRLDRIERAEGSGWYDETAQRGFSFTETVSVDDTSGLKGVYVEDGKSKAEAVYGLKAEHPYCITWQDDTGVRYRATQAESCPGF